MTEQHDTENRGYAQAPDQIPLPPAFPDASAFAEPPRERFSFRMIAIPLIGMLLHHLLLNLLALLGTVVYNTAYAIPAGMNIEEMARESAPWVQAFASVALLVTAVPLYIFYIRSRENVHPGHVLREPLNRTDKWIRILSYTGAALVLTQGLLFLLQELSKNIEFLEQAFNDYDEIIDLIAGTEVPFWFNFVALVIAAPIAEELLFRGIIMGEWMRTMPNWMNILFQGILFGLFHMNFLQTAYVIIPGLLLGAVYLRTKHILAPILMHMLYNFCGGILPDLLQDSPHMLGAVLGVELLVAVFGFIYFFARRLLGRRAEERNG